MEPAYLFICSLETRANGAAVGRQVGAFSGYLEMQEEAVTRRTVSFEVAPLIKNCSLCAVALADFLEIVIIVSP